MYHDIVNELICWMGQKVLRLLLGRIKSHEPNWYAIHADEATVLSAMSTLMYLLDMLMMNM